MVNFTESTYEVISQIRVMLQSVPASNTVDAVYNLSNHAQKAEANDAASL
jgi:hypothetical protein